ncbi:MAG: 4-hydroxy-tetrahydrodipicolinate reductase [Pseudomonadota bacterium]
MKIAINGKSGRMGQMVSDCIAERNNGMVICSLMDQPAVIIDFSSPLSTLSLLPFAIEHRIPLVIGTTGFTASQEMQITHAAEKIPIVKSPNMSIGANLCVKSVETIATHLVRCGIQFEVGIMEIHHDQKKDAPSGTALLLGEMVESSRYGGKPQYASLRIGQITGEHAVMFSLNGEQLVVRHHADSRKNFALGALMAAEWILKEKTPCLYGMQEVLGLDKA